MVSDITGRFAHIKTNSYAEYGVNENDLVFIAGSGYAPVDDDDNYKLLFVASLVVDGLPQNKGFTIARKNLELLSEDESETLRKQMDELLEQAKEKIEIQ